MIKYRKYYSGGKSIGEMEDKNRDARVKQQKNTFIRNMIICASILLIFTLVFWLVSKNASGTEISFNEFQTNRDDACKKYLGKTIIINGNEFIINAITTEEGLKITYSKEYFDSLFDYSEINLSDYQHLYKINITICIFY